MSDQEETLSLNKENTIQKRKRIHSYQSDSDSSSLPPSPKHIPNEEEEEEEEEIDAPANPDSHLESVVEDYLLKEFDIPPPLSLNSTKEVLEPILDDDALPTEQYLSERFLTWNHHGYVLRHFDSSTPSHATLEIVRQNLDGTIERPRFQDTKNINLASLSNRGVLFGRTGLPSLSSLSPLPSDRALLLFYDFSSLHQKKPWELSLPPNEYIRCLSCTDDLLIVLTGGSRRYIRLFSPSGVQLLLLNLSGEAVSVCSRDSLLLIVTHEGTDIASRDHRYKYYLYDTSQGVLHLSLLSQGDFSPSPSSTVSWTNFSSLLLPLIKDSAGVLWCLAPILSMNKTRQDLISPVSLSPFIWTPLHDFSEDLSSFIVQVETDHLLVATTRPGESEPRPSDRPRLEKIPLRLPLIGNFSSSSGNRSVGLEDMRIRQQIACSVAHYSLQNSITSFVPSHEIIEAKKEGVPMDEVVLDLMENARLEMDKVNLKLFQKFIKLDFLDKAMDVALLLVTNEAIEAAAAYAQHMNKSKLYQKVASLSQDKQ